MRRDHPTIKKYVRQPDYSRVSSDKLKSVCPFVPELGSEYVKLEFKVVLFTDECRATLDGPDGRSKDWVANGSSRPIRVRRQQGGGGIMF